MPRPSDPTFPPSVRDFLSRTAIAYAANGAHSR